jgi:ATP-binding cassette, subfamily B, bacterial MsbA
MLALTFMVLLAAFESTNITLISPFLKILLSKEQPGPPDAKSDKILELAGEKSAFLRAVKAWAIEVKHKAQELIYLYFYSHGKEQGLRTLCILILIMIFIANIFQYLQAYIMATLEQAATRDIRSDVVTKYTQISLSFYDRHHSGDLISRVIGDMTIVNNTIARGFTNFVKNLVQILILLIFLLFISWKLLFFAVVILPPVFLIINKIGKSVFRKSNRLQKSLSTMTEFVSELLNGMKIVQAYRAEKQEIKRFNVINDVYYKNYVRLKRLQAASTPSTEFLTTVALIALLWYGGHLVLRGEFDATLLMVFLLLMAQMLNPIKMISQVYPQIQQGMAAMKRVLDVLDIEPKIENPKNPVILTSFAESIVFQNVKFEYDKEKLVLYDINFNIPYGHVVALVGHSGAGKSTIASLLPRFYDPYQGAILFDGVDIKTADLSSLRGQMSVVTQEVFLSSGSIIENIAIGDESPDLDKVILAAQNAYAHDFIMQLPEQYETNTGERGVLLSGGQRQRIAIARALYRNTPILILDEATSNLDSESESLIQQALIRLMENRTTLVIAHRISTIQRADKIIVLDKGKIVQTGKHDELINQEGIYKRLYSLQFAV